MTRPCLSYEGLTWWVSTRCNGRPPWGRYFWFSPPGCKPSTMGQHQQARMIWLGASSGRVLSGKILYMRICYQKLVKVLMCLSVVATPKSNKTFFANPEADCIKPHYPQIINHSFRSHALFVWCKISVNHFLIANTLHVNKDYLTDGEWYCQSLRGVSC